MLYYLQEDSVEDRLLIDTTIHPGYKTEESTDASCWLEAKKKFGFELTPLQMMLLGETPNQSRRKSLV